MDHAEITVLTGLCPAGRMLRSPWRYDGFTSMVRHFLKEQTVLMGREAWFDFPFKDDQSITPWVLSSNQRFQLRTKAQYPHVQFTDTADVLHITPPLKGIWWVLGGFDLYRTVFKMCHSIEAVVVNNTIGAVDLLSNQNLIAMHSCINPFDRHQKCVRYERAKVSQLPVQEVQTARIR